MMQLFKRRKTAEEVDAPEYDTRSNWKVEIVNPLTNTSFKAHGWTEETCAALRAALLEALTKKEDLHFVWRNGVFLRMKFSDLDDATIWLGRDDR